MKKLLMIFTVLVMSLSSCGPGKNEQNSDGSTDKASSVSGEIRIEGSAVLFPLMNKWKQEFEKSQPGVKIIVKSSDSDKGLRHLAENNLQIAMVSHNQGKIIDKEDFWAVSVAKDAVVPVISFDNNNLQKIVVEGVTKDKLAAVFTGKIKTWGQLLNVKSNDPIIVHKLSGSCGTSHTWAEFLNMKPDNFIGTQLYDEKSIPAVVGANKNAIGYASIVNVYDFATGFRKKNLYVLPVDLNSSHQADDNELVFDKLDDIKNAIAAGKYPSPPARNLYLVCKTLPTDAATIAFIKWVITIGQSFCAQYGFVNIDQNEASGYLKQLK